MEVKDAVCLERVFAAISNPEERQEAIRRMITWTRLGCMEHGAEAEMHGASATETAQHTTCISFLIAVRQLLKVLVKKS